MTGSRWGRGSVNVTKTYLALAALALSGAGLTAVRPALVQAAALFESRPLDASRFAVLARPVGSTEWNLLLLEQLQARPLCWQTRTDGLIDPALNRFDYTGICNRYLDSNGYSLRVGEEDLASRYRLRVQQSGSELLLQAFSPDHPAVLLVGRGQLPLRDREGFVALNLEPGWQLRRRSFGGQNLNHVYFSSGASLDQLIARSAAAGEARAAATGNGIGTGIRSGIRSGSGNGNTMGGPTSTAIGGRLSQALRPLVEGEPQASGSSASEEPPLAQPGRTIALQVIPFRE
jgi:hypothetical protein